MIPTKPSPWHFTKFDTIDSNEPDAEISREVILILALFHKTKPSVRNHATVYFSIVQKSNR
jgi:hypothetical protein